MKRYFKNIFHITLYILCVLLALFIMFCIFLERYLPVTYEAAALPTSKTTLDNPYCGFYQMQGYTLSDSPEQDAALWAQQFCDRSSYQLLLIEINLKNYANSSLSWQALQQVEQILSTCQSAKKQVILRFLYDWDGTALTTEPATRSQIANHMTQLSTPVNAHKDCVYLLQGIFTGNHGEMHDSRFASSDDIRELMTHLANVMDNSIYLSVRTPAQLRSILKTQVPLASKHAYQGDLQSRLGLFNDGLLGSVFDLGTYDDTPLTSRSALDEKGTRQEEIRFQNRLCHYVPNGGEVVISNPCNDIASAVKDFSDMHISYLNADYDPEVFAKWKTSAYEGGTGYNYIQAHLGYRYVLQASSLEFRPITTDSATLSLTIGNEGFAPAYRKFDTSIIVTNTETNESFTVDTDIDNRRITGSDSSIFLIDLDIRTWEPSTYELSLSMTDPATELPIHFAHASFENSTSIPIGTLHMD